MAVRIQLRRGNNSEFSGSLVLTAGEAALVEDEKVLIVGDGSSTYTQLKAAGKFINYQTEQGLGVVGGAHGTSETPLTVKGVGSQTAALLKVTDSSDGAILQIFDDEGPTVRLEDHGDTNEVFMLLKQQASGTANALELKDSADTDQMTISCDGEVAITPTNNQTADAPSLDVKGSGANNSGIFRVKDGSNNAVLTVKSDGVESEQTVTVDGGSIIAQVEDTAASNVTITASATDSDKVVTVDGNSGTENLSITAGGKIDAKDIEVSATGRSVADASILRADEIFARLEKQVSPFSFSVTGTYNRVDINAGLRLLRLEGAENDDARKRQTFDPANVGSAFQLKNVQGTGSSPETHPADENDTNPYLIYVPANSGPFTIYFCVYTNTGQTNDNMEIYSYTSTDAATGKATVGTMSVAGGTDTNNFDFRRSQLLAHVANSSTDLYYGFAYGLSNTGSADFISTMGTATLSIGKLAHEGERGVTNANGADPAELLPMVTFFRGHLGMGGYTRIQPS